MYYSFEPFDKLVSSKQQTGLNNDWRIHSEPQGPDWNLIVRILKSFGYNATTGGTRSLVKYSRQIKERPRKTYLFEFKFS